MAKNDVVLLDGIVDQRIADELPSQERDEVFEFLAIEEILKHCDLSFDEIESGWIDGRDDGGIDGAYIIINGNLFEDPDDFVWPRSNASIEVWLLTCKHHATFAQAPLDSLLATIQEFFDLAKDDGELAGSYSDDLMHFRALFKHAYRRLSISRPIIKIHVAYVSRGDITQIGDSVLARSQQITVTLSDLFSSCTVDFKFVGASELVEMHRKAKRFSIDLPFLEHLATGKDSYVLLVRLEDYWKFVSDETGSLRRYLFDSNVRDFLGANQVNEDIAESLADDAGPDFWWLNNGITILATNATVPGKTIQLQDIQIVNGLQTTESIYRHFQQGSAISRDRAVLVKIIVSSDAQSRDRIIRATNNQSPVEIAALHATDKIQRDIEDVLARDNWYYERRKNYYRNIGKPQSRFVTPLYIASAVLALVLRNPGKATRLRGKFMHNQDNYEIVFDDGLPIDIWPLLATIYKQVDSELMRIMMQQKFRERFLATWRPLVAFLCVSKRLKTFSYRLGDLHQFRETPLSESELTDIWKIISPFTFGAKPTKRPRPGVVLQCCDSLEKEFAIVGKEIVGRRGLSFEQSPWEPLPVAFLESVNRLLPPQPWKPGLHSELAKQLNCRSGKVSRAIQQLIAQGSWNRQEDGVVFDSAGKVIAVDSGRVLFTVEQLNADGHTYTGYKRQ